MASVEHESKVNPTTGDPEKVNYVSRADETSDDLKSDDASAHKQAGVKGVEAITSAWTKKTLWMMFALLYLVAFVDMLIVSLQSNLNAYITSEFSKHGLLATTSIVSSILGGSSNLAIAKIIDVWGRIEGFMLMLLVSVIGLIMKSVCQNVETYAAAHTFYWVGHLGLLYVIDIIVADMTSLRNRALMVAINGTPTIATTFAGPEIAQLFYERVNFRWAFGAFCIILVVVCIPVIAIMLLNHRKSLKMGITEKTKSERTWMQSIKYYFIQFDVVGIILTTAGFSLVLLPFSLASSTAHKWASASIITMIVIGVLSLAAFVIWEKYFAPVQYFPFRYLKERTIIGSCLLYGFMFASIFCWDAYYSSYLQVVHNQSIAHSGYILNTFSLTSSFISPLVGLYIRRFGDFKYLSYAGIPIMALATALLIPFRTPSTHVGLLAFCQILNGIYSGIFATCGVLACQAVVTHQEVAVVTALWSMFGSIGAAIGSTIAGGIWTNIVPRELYEHLPEGNKDLTAAIYGSLSIQQEYPVGTEIRDAINFAYADVQRKMVIAGAAFIPICLVCIFMWKNVNVRKLEAERGAQTKGTIF